MIARQSCGVISPKRNPSEPTSKVAITPAEVESSWRNSKGSCRTGGVIDQIRNSNCVGDKGELEVIGFFAFSLAAPCAKRRINSIVKEESKQERTTPRDEVYRNYRRSSAKDFLVGAVCI